MSASPGTREPVRLDLRCTNIDLRHMVLTGLLASRHSHLVTFRGSRRENSSGDWKRRRQPRVARQRARGADSIQPLNGR